ncbi:hypothetical protein Skr01_73590 [Sphaerisporangium krabiense]|uniref:Uncharacterized protein n=1 Tax=Sphaerisporangium krabiense TaxID=763782 RepID=A0A7W8Z0K7_9ACTN|nr:hypothetical protein [Sphaerisporangium krabiense]MBB5625127.1 hypothetical protein [Sphaerisporangium krabiense]GII67274.1 hypothetical protein Skr01_73590 [Sphaerisporangium krabiense]
MAKWKAGIASVALGLLALLVPTTPVTAEPKKPAPEPAVAQECGADLKQHAAKLAATGKSGTATCVRKQARKAKKDTTGAKIAADICGGSSTLTRTAACVIDDGIVLIFTVPNGAVIGTIEYTVSSLTTLDYSSLQWSQSWHYQANSVAGPSIPAVLDTLVYAEPECLASCTVSSSGLVGGSALPGRVHSTTTHFTSPVSGYKWGARGGMKYWFANAAWVNPTTNIRTTTPAAHRCDDALPNYPKGCVYDSVRPVHDVQSSRYPEYARHLRYAITYYGMPSILTRTQNQTIIDNNYKTACPPGYPKPTTPGTWSCDEYPYKSTYNGASSQPYGRNIMIIDWNTGYGYDCGASWLDIRGLGDSGGYSVCMIPLAENSLGGSDLGAFYYKSRVLDGDQFQVRVI